MKFLKPYLVLLNLLALFNKRVIQNVFAVVILTLLLKDFGFYKEWVIVLNFGLSEALDTFFIVILVPGFIMNVFISAFMGVVIPKYIAELQTGKDVSSFQANGFL